MTSPEKPDFPQCERQRIGILTGRQAPQMTGLDAGKEGVGESAGPRRGGEGPPGVGEGRGAAP